jgi:hypothetical protein
MPDNLAAAVVAFLRRTFRMRQESSIQGSASVRVSYVLRLLLYHGLGAAGAGAAAGNISIREKIRHKQNNGSVSGKARRR